MTGVQTCALPISLYLRLVCSREDGAPPPVDLAAEKRNGDFVRILIHENIATAAHDISDGGLLVALAEMAIASGIGARLAHAPSSMPAPAFWFGEDQARYLATVHAGAVDAIIARADIAGVPVRRIGTTGGEALAIAGERAVPVETLSERFEAWLPGYMAGTLPGS